MKRGAARAGGGVDWSQVRSRLENAQAAFRSALVPDETRTALVLEERARRLARAGEDAGSAGPTMDLVFFRSGGARYGIDATVVLRVARMTVLTPLHGVPGPFLGVMAWPAGVLPVANIERLLSQAGTAGAPEGGMVLVVGSVRPELAVLAGEVEGVESVSVESVRAVGDSPGGLVRGALPDGTLVVDGRVLLADSLRAAPESRNGNQKT